VFRCRAFCATDPTGTGLAIANLHDGHVHTLAAPGPRLIIEPTWIPGAQTIVASCRTDAATGC
jgi:hypothetical protein